MTAYADDRSDPRHPRHRELMLPCCPHPPVSYAPEFIADDSGKWCGNALRFATRPDAEAWARNLSLRWTMVRQWRVVESLDPVTEPGS